MTYTLWLTGLPCAGKTTIAKELLKVLDAVHLDGDIVRKSLTKDLGFSPEDRKENLRRISTVARMLNDSGKDVIASFVSPRRSMRRMIRRNIGKRMILVYIRCSVEECIRRDDKGMYAKALRREIPMFTGVSAPYEEPRKPDVTVDTDKMTLEECVDRILKFLEGEEIIKPRCTLFIGRFSPPHKAHKYLFDTVLNNGGRVVVAIRDTPLSDKDPLTVEQRRTLIEALYPNNANVKVVVIPDINEVCVGRKVGYKIMAVPEKIRIISATKVRKGKYDDVPKEIRDLVREMLDGKEEAT